MMKMIKFYLKDNLLSFIITTVIATALGVCIISSNDLIYTRYYDDLKTAETSVFIYFIVLIMILTIATPISLLNFKMKKIGIDKYYSLPIKKNMLYLAKYLSGLLLIFIPYFISFFASFLVILMKDNLYSYGFIWLLFIVMLLCSICIYTIIFFTIYCQNTMVDGIVIVGIVAILLPGMILTANNFYNSVCVLINKPTSYFIEDAPNFFLFSPLFSTYSLISNKIAGLSVNIETGQIISYVVLLVGAIAAVFAFLFKSKREKAEDTLEKSNSWFGYKLFVPIIATYLLALMPYFYGWLLSISCLYVGHLIYRRTFKLNRSSWITIIVFSVLALIYVIVL